MGALMDSPLPITVSRAERVRARSPVQQPVRLIGLVRR